MPKPPILPVPDRNAIFESGKTWDEWLENTESAGNCQKMREIFENTELDAEEAKRMNALPRKAHVIAIAEPWCGDVVRNAPYLMKLAEASDNVEIRFIEREQHPDFFVRFVTNGGESVPKFVFCSQEFVEVGNWGPMCSSGRKLIAMGKSVGDVGAARRKLGEMPMDERNAERKQELLELFEIAAMDTL